MSWYYYPVAVIILTEVYFYIHGSIAVKSEARIRLILHLMYMKVNFTFDITHYTWQARDGARCRICTWNAREQSR